MRPDRFPAEPSEAPTSPPRLHHGPISRAAAALLRAEAFTLGRHIFLSRSAALEVARATPGGEELLAHELVHVEQYRRRGVASFLLRYFGDYLAARAAGRSHRAAYESIGFEREVRERASIRPSRSQEGTNLEERLATSGSPGDPQPGA